ncbi:ABC transporter ATP-binding protein [Candidatus Saccharibacteria bacterium]|nr:MAG: ABC transporter ATP-binding protein [Candidatus Saccharibacteria bacterium]
MKKARKKQDDGMKVAIRYYLGCVQKYPRYIWGVVFVMPLTSLFGRYIPPLILANVINQLTSKQKIDGLWATFGDEVLLYILVLLIGIALWRGVDYFMWRLEQNIRQDISEQVFRHLLAQSLDFHANNFSGSLVSQTNKLINGYIRVQDSTIYQVYPMMWGFVWAILILTPKAPLYSLFLGVLILVFLSVSMLLARGIYQHLARAAAAESHETGQLADAITNIGVIKSFARRNFETHRFHEATATTRHYIRLFARAHQRQMNIMGVLNRTIIGGSLVIALISVVHHGANIGTAFLIFSYTASIAEQLFEFGNATLRSYNRALSDAREMATKLNQEPTVKDPRTPEELAIRDGHIEFQAVTFIHSGADDAIFEKFNLAIKPGEKIGLVGHSGSGKTTFTRLLLRFSDIQDGAIRIDGQDISQITQEDLHSTIAYVPQEPLLFHRSITENIAYGKLDADEAAIKTAAKFAHAHDFIRSLPKGYDTLVGERGVKLSGGQRQRIAIARAMLKDAPILVLDEATSALDSESEVLIQDALWKLMEGRTTIVIAHRLSTIQKMDRIVVLDEGRIVEEGTHRELLSRKGTDAKLWAHQSGGFIDE